MDEDGPKHTVKQKEIRKPNMRMEDFCRCRLIYQPLEGLPGLDLLDHDAWKKFQIHILPNGGELDDDESLGTIP